MVTTAEIKQLWADIQSGAIKDPNKFVEKINQYTKELTSQTALSAGAKTSTEQVESANRAWDGFIKQIQSAGEKYGTLAFKGILLTDTLRQLTAQFKDTSAFRETQVGVDNVSESYKQLGQTASSVIKSMGFSDASVKWIMALSDSASYARQMENSLINLSAASGTLNEFLNKTGNSFKNLDEVAMKFDMQNLKVANSMGILKPEVEKVALSLGEIPGALDAAFNVKGIGRVSELQATMTLAKATGQSYATVVDKLKRAYEDFNLTGEKAIKFQAQMASASRELGMPLKSVQSAIEGVAEAFRKFGDNTGSAVKLTSQLVPALKEVGVAQRQILEITQSVAGSISQMSTASRAFLSGRTGGPGGLRGAMQIEAMLMKGDAAGVAKMSEEALRKQFGRVVGVEEATKSQSAAAQFERQRQLLESGAFGIKLGGPEATKFLDAMSKGKVFDVTKAGKKPEDALAETMKLGNDILDKNRDAIVENTNNIMYNTAALQSFRDLKILRGTTGSESVALKSKMEARAKEEGREAAALAGKKKISGDEYLESGKKGLVKSITRDIPDTVKSTAGAMIDQFLEEVKSLKKDKAYTPEKAAQLKKEYAAKAGLKLEMFDKAVKQKDNIPLSYYIASDIMEEEKTGGFGKAKKQMGTAPSTKTYMSAAMKEREESEYILSKEKSKKSTKEEDKSSSITIKMECPICHQKHIEKTIDKADKGKTQKGITGTAT